jgi:hypothetical protein
MTIQVRITKEDNSMKAAKIIQIDKSSKKRHVVAKLIDKGDAYVGVVYGTQDIVIEEEK